MPTHDQDIGAAVPVAPQHRLEPIQPVALTADLDPDKVILGEQLFHDPRLSKDNTVSCATCHDLSQGGTDGLPRSLGMGGRAGAINAPTVFNSSYNIRQFWDGRAADLEEQVDGPIAHPDEMDADWEHVIATLRADQSYRESFLTVFRGLPTPERVRVAIAEFERSLITPNARFDRYLRGDDNALTGDELAGYQLFKDYGCIACHQGAGVGGNMFQTFGVLGDYFSKRGNLTEADYGRFNITGQESDRHMFKVPSLRNVALTRPYLHDGTVDTLEQAIEVMGTFQLGVEFKDSEIAKIATFLRTLTGEYQGKPLSVATGAGAAVQ